MYKFASRTAGIEKTESIDPFPLSVIACFLFSRLHHNIREEADIKERVR